MMHELCALENISVHLCYVALVVSFRHSMQTENFILEVKILLISLLKTCQFQSKVIQLQFSM